MTIFGYTSERIILARLPSGIEVTTTVHTYAGSDAGPTLYVQAAQHGREVTGTEVLSRLHDRLDSTAFQDAHCYSSRRPTHV